MPISNPPGNTTNAISSIYRAVSRVTQPISGASDGTIVAFEVEKEAEHITQATGVVTVDLSNKYILTARLSMDVQNFSGAVETWVEYFNGTTWEFLDDSGQIKELDRYNEGAIYYTTGMTLLAGAQLRLKVRSSSSNLSLQSTTLANGVVSPSVAISIVNV